VNQPIVSSDQPIAVIGGSVTDPNTLTDVLRRCEKVVCADGGANIALSKGIKPDAVIGDMDSISDAARTAFSDVLCPIADQDSTDFDKVLRNIDAPMVLGVGLTGGRIDHELGALNVLVRHPSRRCILVAEETITLLCPPSLHLDLPKGSAVSLFPMAEVGCASEGLRWGTNGMRFSPDGRLGTLNKVDGPVALAPDAPKMLLILPRAALDITLAALGAADGTWPAL